MLMDLFLCACACAFLFVLPAQMTNPKNGMLNPKAMQGRGGQMNMNKMAQMVRGERESPRRTMATRCAMAWMNG